MKIVRRLVIALVLALGASVGAHAEDLHPALYSFADLYRLTLSAVGAEELRFPEVAAEPQLRLAAAPAPAPEPRFTITPVPGPRGWVLFLAGLAAAAWVAHRRLTYAY